MYRFSNLRLISDSKLDLINIFFYDWGVERIKIRYTFQNNREKKDQGKI